MGIIGTTLLRGVQALVGASPTTVGQTVLDDDSVVQVLPVVPDIARRSLVTGETGMWVANMDNVHTAADNEDSQINPYVPAGSVPAGSAFPVNVPSTQDLWLISAAVLRISGAGDLNTGTLQIDPVPRQQAWGIEDDGSAVVTSGEILLAGWIGLDTNTVVSWAKGGDGSLGMKRIGLRLPRNTLLIFRTNSSATATFRCVLILGLFPEGLGQDVLT